MILTCEAKTKAGINGQQIIVLILIRREQSEEYKNS